MERDKRIKLIRLMGQNGFDGIHAVPLEQILELSNEAQDLLGRLLDGETMEAPELGEVPKPLRELYLSGIASKHDGQVVLSNYTIATAESNSKDT